MAQYVDDKKLYEVLSKYCIERDEAIANNKTLPRVPEYAGEAILKIGEGFARKFQYSSYSFKDEMINDAVLNCLTYIDNWDPTKSKYPFAYFTQITYYAFLRRIEAEKKQQYKKYKMMQKMHIMNFNDMEYISGSSTRGYENIDEFIEEYEKKMEEKKAILKEKQEEKKRLAALENE